MNILSEKFNKYIYLNTKIESNLLRQLVRETYQKMQIPQMQVGRLEGALLRLLVRLSRARHVLEIGTFTGYSALVMAEGLPKNGRLITCDIDPEATAMAKKFWAKSRHGRKIELKLGPALATLKTLKGPFDFVFIDADKENYPNYWEKTVPLVRSGGLFVIDNVLWSGRVLHPRDAESRAIARLNERIKNDRRVEAVMLPVRDGITLAWKK